MGFLWYIFRTISYSALCPSNPHDIQHKLLSFTSVRFFRMLHVERQQERDNIDHTLNLQRKKRSTRVLYQNSVSSLCEYVLIITIDKYHYLSILLCFIFISNFRIVLSWLNTLRPRQNDCHYADGIFKCIFLNEDLRIVNKISLKFVPKRPINNIPALVQIMT